MEKNEAMKMMMGRTWNAKITPYGPLVLAPRMSPNTNSAAGLHVAQHGVHARADGLEDLAEIGLEHQQGEGELQAQSPGEDAQLDVALVRGEQPGDRQDDQPGPEAR